jgi:hypothetical protein
VKELEQSDHTPVLWQSLRRYGRPQCGNAGPYKYPGRKK